MEHGDAAGFTASVVLQGEFADCPGSTAWDRAGAEIDRGGESSDVIF